MARGDGRLGTWQVLLTISMVIIPLSAHGKAQSHPVRACRQCAAICARRRARAGIKSHLLWRGFARKKMQLFRLMIRRLNCHDMLTVGLYMYVYIIVRLLQLFCLVVI